jgi:hypothetical protein
MTQARFSLGVTRLAVLGSALLIGCGGSGKRTKDGGSTDTSTSPEAEPSRPDVTPPETGAADTTAPAPETARTYDSGADDAAGAAYDAAGVPAVDASQDVTEDADEDGPPGPADVGLGPDTATPSSKVTVVVLPDTQYYSSGYNAVFFSQTSWIATQKPSLNIAAVLHVGDVVDSDVDSQWSVARAAMNDLDKAKIPYVLVPGNHDYGDLERTTKMDAYFGPTSMPWLAGTMTPGQIENSYALIDLGPQRWLVLGLEFGPRDAVMTWAKDVLARHPQYPAMIVTHAYLYRDGTRYDYQALGLAQSFIPQAYGYTATQGINDGEQIWQQLVLPYPNVRMVFSGHDTAMTRLASTRPDGSVVYQMLSDFQWYRIDQSDYYGGGGYLRVLQFDYASKQIGVQTYSPYLDQYLTDDQNQFTIALD